MRFFQKRTFGLSTIFWLRPRAKPEAAPSLSAVNENDYWGDTQSLSRSPQFESYIVWFSVGAVREPPVQNWLLKEFLFLCKIVVTNREVIASYG